eukprot:SAG22_NODE_9281_length_599_cov_0.532000_1_plen_40_part_10
MESIVRVGFLVVVVLVLRTRIPLVLVLFFRWEPYSVILEL